MSQPVTSGNVPAPLKQGVPADPHAAARKAASVAKGRGTKHTNALNKRTGK